MYHVEGRRQSEVAAHFRLSQATVSRLLKKALDEGIVRITVSPPPETHIELGTELRDRFGLAEAIVADVAEDREGAIMARIGEAAAHFLEATIEPGEVIGVSSWSQTILKMIDNIHPMKSGSAKAIVQMLGGIGNPSVQKHATQLTTRLAALTGAEPMILNAPALVASREARLVLLGDAFVRETMEEFAAITLAIVGIGAMHPSRMLAESGNIFSGQELEKVEAAGAVAEMGLRFFDREGRSVPTAFEERVIGITPDELRRVRRVIAVAGGAAKTEAIAAVLRSGLVHILVTDHFTAARLVGKEVQVEAL
jgi:DNA-binding transcriptional regulator LsrR (DeoR family)